MSGDVLCGETTDAFGKSGIIASLLFGAKFSLGMREEVGAVAVEREPEEQLSIKPRGWNLLCGETGNRRA
jgi:hypothetical protein